jgi:hypothetical protein
MLSLLARPWLAPDAPDAYRFRRRCLNQRDRLMKPSTTSAMNGV